MDGTGHEQRRLSLLGPRLPVAVPEPLGRGRAGEGFPWCWSVYGRLDGRNPDVDALDSPETLAEELADLVRAMHRVDTHDGPPRFGPFPCRLGTRPRARPSPSRRARRTRRR